MSDLVKTGDTLRHLFYHGKLKDKSIWVPIESLDVLEEMLKKELKRLNKTQSERLYGTQAYYSQAIRESEEMVSHVFARFKKENGI